MLNQAPDQCFTQRIPDDSHIETFSVVLTGKLFFGRIVLLPSKRGLNGFEKQIHLLLGRDAGDDEPEVATRGCPRIINERRINAVLD